MRDLFPLLPAHIQDALLIGSVGKAHLINLADDVLTEAGVTVEHREKLTTLGVELLSAAYESDPLDGDIAGRLLSVAPELPGLDSRVTATARCVASRWRPPENPAYLLRLMKKREFEKIQRYFSGQIQKEPENLYWLQQALSLSLYEGDAQWLAELWPRAEKPPETLQAALAKSEGDLFYFSREYSRALAAYERAFQLSEFPALLLRIAEAHLAMGESEQGARALTKALALRPWMSSVVLRLHDVLENVGQERSVPPGDVAVCFYTYNKDRELAAVLEAQLDAVRKLPEMYERARFFVLNNGCKDNTAALLKRMRGEFSTLGGDWDEQFHILSLPVNVGAPAARNWLMTLPEARGCDWVAYMDDDAMPPEDWPGMLGAAAKRYPEAGVWGCKVLDAARPAVIQHADLHLTPPGDLPPEGENTPHYQRWFAYSKLHHQELDMGQFSYMRPCVSVTGCCHLFRTKTLLDAGGFDIRYTPSQYDDAEHDLRLGMEGRLPVYQGHMEVLHAKRSGRAAHASPTEEARAAANMFKLQRAFSREEFAALMAHWRGAQEQDLRDKTARLQSHGVETAFFAG